MPDGENRTQRRDRRRRPSSKARQALPIIGIILFVAAVWVGWDVFLTESDPKDGKTTVVKVETELEKKEKKEEKVVITQRTFVILGVSQSSGSKTLTGAAEVVFDPARNRIGGLFLDPETFVVIPGRGLQSIADGFKEGPKALAAAISALLGIESEGYLIIDGDEFSRLKVNKDIGSVFEQYSDGNVPRAESKALGEQMSLILGALAQIHSSVETMPIGRFVSLESRLLPWGSTAVVITAQPTEALLATLVRMRRAGRSVALVIIGGPENRMSGNGLTTYHVADDVPWRDLESISLRVTR